MLTFSRHVLCALVLLPTLLSGQEHAIALKASLALDGKVKTLRNTVVVVEGSKIKSIGGPIPAGAKTYDLSGLTMTPGWIDTHSPVMYHFDRDNRFAGRNEPPAEAILRGVDNAIMTLNAGFTTIQSPGQNADKDLRDALARGIIPGPRLLTSLQPLMENSGPPEKLRELVRERK